MFNCLPECLECSMISLTITYNICQYSMAVTGQRQYFVCRKTEYILHLFLCYSTSILFKVCCSIIVKIKTTLLINITTNFNHQNII